MTCLRLISRLVKNSNFHKIYLINYNELESRKNSTGNFPCLLDILKILESETSSKNCYSENKNMTRLRLISGLVTNPNFHKRYL